MIPDVDRGTDLRWRRHNADQLTVKNAEYGSSIVRLQQLSRPRRELVDRIQRLGFGRITSLSVRSGEPVLDPPPHITRVVKFGARHLDGANVVTTDFELKTELVEFLELLSQVGDGTISILEVRNGLPFRACICHLSDGGRAG